jgi:nitrite reductase/ring-hydroxylating ferredoxin subunit
MSQTKSAIKRGAGQFRGDHLHPYPLTLSEGDVQGTKVTCPWHGAHFDLKTGAVLGPPAQKGVPSYKVTVEGDDIKVEV